MEADAGGAKDIVPLKYATMHNIGFFVFPGHQILDLAGPLAVFDMVRKVVGQPFYTLDVLSHTGGMVPSDAGVPVGSQPVSQATPDTLIVVGGDIASMTAPEQVSAVAAVAAITPRIASICTGAFLLAETGLLNGRRATTHWRQAHRLQQTYPAIQVDMDRIFIADGPIWSSAGVTAGIDLALALLEADRGVELAREVARELVVYHRRPGGQSQFSSLSRMEPASDRIRIALTFARDHLHEPLPVERLAEAAHLSVRQFGRMFQKETGETPAKAVERLRVEAARLRIQEGSEPIEHIAQAVGFSDPERMRRAFVKLFGLPPQAIRRAHRGHNG